MFMKRIFLFAMLLCVSLMGYSQKWNGLKSDNPTTIKKTLVSSSENEIIIDVKVDGYYSTKVNTPNGEQLIISGTDMAPMLVEGMPNLPSYPISVIIGDNAEMEVSIIKSEYTDIEGVEVAPSKGNLKRKVDPNNVEYVYGDVYQQDAFYPAQAASLEKPYILRDFRGQNITVYPYTYNPVTKTLRVYTNMTISAKKVGDDGENKKEALRKARTAIDPEVRESYKRRFINYDACAKRDFIVDEGEMLIVCVDDYLDELEPLVEWKNISGRPTKIVSVSETGTLDNLKNYLKNYYQQNPDLTYVLLVGEYSTLPPYPINSYYDMYSDNYYGMYDGNDDYEEVLIGRLPVANEADATVQVNKIIYYERDINESDTWLSKCSGVAADEGAGGGHFGEADYQHIDYVCDTLMNYTFTEVSKHYEYINNPTAPSMVNDFSKGLGIINYCNHGYPTGWSVASFENSNVHQMSNDNKLPVIWSVACNNGQFNVSECFGEAWMRAKNSSTGAGTGAVGGMFSWIEQPWIPPMYGQDEMVAILTEWRPNYKHTLGGASLNGNMHILDVCPEDNGDTHNTWLLFGDPSMMMRTKAPQSMNVSYSPSTLLIGMSSLTVNANTEFGIATLSINGEVIASSYVENGVANLTFPNINQVATAKLVVVGYNKVTEIIDIEVIPADGAYVMYDSHVINDDNGQLDYGENIDLTLLVKNIANDPANNVTVELSTESEYVTINNGTATIASIAKDQVMEGQFNFTVASNVPDNTKIKFDVRCSDGTEVWVSEFTVVAHAPIFAINNISLDNESGELLPGESATFVVTFSNVGSSTARDVKTYIESSSDNIVFENTILDTDVALPGEQYQVTTTVTALESAVQGGLYQIACKVMSGYYSKFAKYDLYAGKIKEDFETGDLSSFEWVVVNANWTVIEDGYEGEYCVASPERASNNKNYDLSLTAETFVDGVISFYRKVSSEEGYDFLEFYIDNTKVAEWSGEVDWGKVEFELESGLHNFKWRYSKDISSSDGDDRAYIDYIHFPPLLIYEVGVNEVVKENNLSIYPNPTTGIVNIDIDTTFDAVIYNYQGQVMMKMYDNNGQIDLTGLTRGMYLIEIRTADNVMVKKIIMK